MPTTGDDTPLSRLWLGLELGCSVLCALENGAGGDDFWPGWLDDGVALAAGSRGALWLLNDVRNGWRRSLSCLSAGGLGRGEGREARVRVAPAQLGVGGEGGGAGRFGEAGPLASGFLGRRQGGGDGGGGGGLVVPGAPDPGQVSVPGLSFLVGCGASGVLRSDGVFPGGPGLEADQSQFFSYVRRRPGQFPLVRGSAEVELTVGNGAQVQAADLVQGRERRVPVSPGFRRPRDQPGSPRRRWRFRRDASFAYDLARNLTNAVPASIAARMATLVHPVSAPNEVSGRLKLGGVDEWVGETPEAGRS